MSWCSRNIKQNRDKAIQELVISITKVHRLERYFQCIMTGCDVGRGKPADIYLAVAKQLRTDPKACLVFEDIIPAFRRVGYRG